MIYWILGYVIAYIITYYTFKLNEIFIHKNEWKWEYVHMNLILSCFPIVSFVILWIIFAIIDGYIALDKETQAKLSKEPPWWL